MHVPNERRQYIYCYFVSMRLIYLILIGVLFVIGCDDPSLDRPAPAPDPVEPINDAVLLSQITINDAATDDIITDINLTYNNDFLVAGVNFTGAIDRNFTFEYAANNRLTSFTKTENGTSTDYEVTYDENNIELKSNNGTADVVRTFSIDLQNRISRSVTEVDDLITEDVVYSYTANFNVDRIDNRNASRTITGFSLLTYVFNNNPFRDLNDIIKFVVFEDFVSYTRYLPTTQEKYSSSPTGSTLESSVTYEYELLPNNFPISRTVATESGGTTINTVERFAYLDN
jgi:hypothetical protein